GVAQLSDSGGGSCSKQSSPGDPRPQAGHCIAGSSCTQSAVVLPLFDNVEQARHSLSPHLVLPPAPALELDHAMLRRPQAQVAPPLAAFHQVPPRPCMDFLAHFDDYTCSLVFPARQVRLTGRDY
ncbi:hypothetical protein BHM03_00057959, partial [Ensete ventricosum]